MVWIHGVDLCLSWGLSFLPDSALCQSENLGMSDEGTHLITA